MADIIITVVSGETTELGLAIPGVQGPVGINTVPSGGIAGDIIVKQSSTNYDASWTATVSGITLNNATLSGTVSNAGTISGGTYISPTLSGTVSTGSGAIIGEAADLLGFYGANAVVQPSGVVIPSGGATVEEVNAAVSGVIVALQSLGLLA